MTRPSKPVVFVLRLALVYGAYLLSQSIPAAARGLWTPVYTALGKMHGLSAQALFETLGYAATLEYSSPSSAFPPSYVVKVEHSSGVRLNYPCLAVDMTFAFFALIAAYPAPWKKKILVIPLGMAAVQTLNFLRVAGLAWIAYAKPQWLDFSHHYAFQFTVVGLIFLMFAWWTGRLKTEKNASPA